MDDMFKEKTENLKQEYRIYMEEERKKEIKKKNKNKKKNDNYVHFDFSDEGIKN